MKKKDAKELLGFSNKQLSDALHISESYIRNSKEFSKTHTALIEALARVNELDAKCEKLQKQINSIQRAMDN